MNTKIRRGLLAVLLAAPLLAAPLAQAEESPRLIAVTGQGEVSVKPDRARLNLAADAMNADLKAAEAEVNKIVRAYLVEAKTLGTKEEHISTAGISINPEYVWDEKARRQQLVGYRARRDINVVIENLDKVGDYILRATKVGVNHVSAPALESSKSGALIEQALVNAANDARTKAKLLAETLGMKLGAVRTLRVNDYAPPPMPMKVMAMRAEAADMGGNQEMGFAAGEIKYSASAVIEFDLIKP
ncbi:MAG TPA: SIMPL domain-containing protein [Solimonas sp.]